MEHVREWVVEESVVIGAEPKAVYGAVADVRRMKEWSPEVFAVWVRGKAVVPGLKYVGFNRRGLFVWFTSAQVTSAMHAESFAFRVSSFGIPVALWGYRIEDIGDGSTRLTEYWEDLRRDHRGARAISLVGKLFTGVPAERRAAVNRDGMRTTLGRVAAALSR